jgi:hypothetical protein
MYNNQMPPCMMWSQMPQYSNMPQCNNMPNNMPYNNMPDNTMDVEDTDLKMMYPRAYFMLIPMIKSHCDKLEGKYGMFFCPSKDEMEDIIEDICKRFEKDIEDEDDEKEKKGKKDKCREEDFDQENDSSRRPRPRPRYGRRQALRDLVGVIFLGELLGRRQRRRPYYGYGPNYGWW